VKSLLGPRVSDYVIKSLKLRICGKLKDDEVETEVVECNQRR
jgi:hypothetical protein